MESAINLAKGSTRDGVGEFYEDGVDDLLCSIPTLELVTGKKPHPALLKICQFYRSRVVALADSWDPPLPEVPKGGPTYLELLEWAEQLVPGFWSIPVTDTSSGTMNRVRCLIKKRIAIDVIDDMDMLRARTPVSVQRLSSKEERRLLDEWGLGDGKGRRKRKPVQADRTPASPSEGDGE